jgi:hypothetical protein
MSRFSKFFAAAFITYAALHAMAGASLVKAGQTRALQHAAMIEAATK